MNKKDPQTDNPAPAAGRPSTRGGRHALVLGLAAVIAVTALTRFHLLDIPLERDEGEYAYAGQLMLEGVPPYAEAYNMKFPGVYAATAVSMALFGQSPAGVHAGLILVNAAAIVMIFLLALRLLGGVAALAAAGSYALLSLSNTVQGTSAHAEHFAVACALGGLLLLQRALESERLRTLLLSGVLFGLACIMKQQGAAFALFGGLVLAAHGLFRRKPEWMRLLRQKLVFAAGVILPIAGMMIWLLAAGVFDRFRFWTFEYASTYVSAVPFEWGLKLLEKQGTPIFNSAPLLFVLAGIGLAAGLWDKETRSRIPFLAGFLLLSIVAVSLGFYFRPHYFVNALPAVALLAGAGTAVIARLAGTEKSTRLRLVVPALVLIAGWGHTLFAHGDYIRSMSDPVKVCRLLYGGNPFPESVEIARYIREHSEPTDTIAVIGSEPQIYFYSRRRGATGYIYTYALMEENDFALSMQEEMIAQIEAARPLYIVCVYIQASWTFRPSSHRLIFEWMDSYLVDNYEQVGSVNIRHPQPTVYDWGWEKEFVRPESGFWICILKRKAL